MGHRGRPRRGENRLDEHAQAGAESEAVGLLLAEAARRGLRPTGLANAVAMDRKALQDLQSVAAPRLKTIQRFTDALGFPPSVARALCNELTSRDRDDIRKGIRSAVRVYCRDAERTVEELDSVLDRLPFAARCGALVAYTKAQSGLDDQWRGCWTYWDDEDQSPVMSPGLMALDHKLQTIGSDFSLRDRIDKRVESGILSAEARIASRWLASALRLTDRQRTELFQSIPEVGPFVAFRSSALEEAYTAARRASRKKLDEKAKRIALITPVLDGWGTTKTKGKRN